MSLQQELNQFIGTEKYYKYMFGIVYTDGIQYLTEKAKCFWLLDLIGSYQHKLKNVDFQVWELIVKNNSAVITCVRDSDQPPLVTQEIEYTDFPMDNIKLYLSNNVLFLPSEY